MKLIYFTHANTDREVFVNIDMVFAIQYSAGHKATHIISNAGGIIPVSESVSKVRDAINSANGAEKEETNGSKTS